MKPATLLLLAAAMPAWAQRHDHAAPVAPPAGTAQDAHGHHAPASSAAQAHAHAARRRPAARS
ncbi:MAG TPA: hypothetical protein VIG88_13750, partial [Lysobacter sp.]